MERFVVMKSRWSDSDAQAFVARYADQGVGEDLALRTYTTRLLGSDPKLVLHGGGNTSVKTTVKDMLGDDVEVLCVKGSGWDMGAIEPAGLPAVRLAPLRRLRAFDTLSDEDMVAFQRINLLDPSSPNPSVETLLHAFLPHKFIDHTHSTAVLALTDQPDGEALLRELYGERVATVPYVMPGFALAKAVADALEAQRDGRAMVWFRHGIVTWGSEARESYEAMIERVTRAEEFLAKRASRPLVVVLKTSPVEAQKRLAIVAPMVRGLLAEKTDDQDRPYRRVILRALASQPVLDFVGSDRGRELAATPVLTADHLVRTKPWPLWIDSLDYDDPKKLHEQIGKAVEGYTKAYRSYLDRHTAAMPPGISPFDALPRVILMPGSGALCAGKDLRAATIARDITEHTLSVKSQIAAMGTYEGLSEDHLFDMEYFSLQHAKLRKDEPALGREVALVTGAAGAIGSAICEELLEQGCHVAVTDLPGDPLNGYVSRLQEAFGGRALGVPLDVTNPDSVAQGFESIIREWGGVDLVVINAGAALVSPLEAMDVEAFRKLERVNTEGTLLLLRQAARHLRLQGTGGDVVMVSTKNVFSPGAKFGAYSATKAAAHQLARIASQEMAELGVRVNMVAPDAVFSHGGRRSGLWAEVGPDRMRARGLDEKGLEDYYRQRNLLKATVTANHVAKAVLFFLTRQTPTTGATLPVDGGLPDATPR